MSTLKDLRILLSFIEDAQDVLEEIEHLATKLGYKEIADRASKDQSFYDKAEENIRLDYEEKEHG